MFSEHKSGATCYSSRTECFNFFLMFQLAQLIDQFLAMEPKGS
jgi:hypothetical protein